MEGWKKLRKNCCLLLKYIVFVENSSSHSRLCKENMLPARTDFIKKALNLIPTGYMPSTLYIVLSQGFALKQIYIHLCTHRARLCQNEHCLPKNKVHRLNAEWNSIEFLCWRWGAWEPCCSLQLDLVTKVKLCHFLTVLLVRSSQGSAPRSEVAEGLRLLSCRGGAKTDTAQASRGFPVKSWGDPGVLVSCTVRDFWKKNGYF